MEPKISSKSWNPQVESDLRNTWNIEKIYEFEPSNNTLPFFVIDTPPPYPSGRPWHIGAAAHYCQIDMIARSARMNGFNVLFPIGIDRNGLPVEIYTEKKNKIRMRQVEREKFLELCKDELDSLELEMLDIMRHLGLSGNFSNHYQTDSESYRKFTQSTFIELWNKGLIYIATRPNNYCSDCGTTIADQEVIYEDRPTRLIYMNFKIKETDNILTIASTRPELLFACQAIIVNPNDERYTNLSGKHAIVPIFKREVPVYFHHYAKPEFGSGAVMVCSYGDHNDVTFFRELGLEEIISLDNMGKTTESAGIYKGMTVNQAREKMISDLYGFNLVEKEEQILHRTPLCERSRTPIEIIPLPDYYLKQLEYVPTLKQLSEKIVFYPEVHRQILTNWLDAVSIDWPISRRRYYGTEIPVWFCKQCSEPHVPDAGQYYRPWKDSAPFSNCKKCNHDIFVGEEKIFDTWMDSSITPLFITSYCSTSNNHFHKATYPTTIRTQGKDIVRTWLYYSMLRCYQLTGALPWNSVWIMGYGVDEKGEKMSKSKGNVIDPFPLIKKYGADTFRFWSASESNLGQDYRCSEQRLDASQKFLSKLWNIGRFLSSFEVDNETLLMEVSSLDDFLEPTDKWVISELSKMICESISGYKEYNFFVPSYVIRDFTWKIFASHYLEMVKGRVYEKENTNKRKSALFTLHKCFSTILLLLAPICPFITDELWRKLYSKTSIHVERFPPMSNVYGVYEKYTKGIIDFNSFVWNKKKETISSETGKPLSLKDKINIKIPSDLNSFIDDLVYMHNITELS